MKTSGVYVIINQLNKKCYVGSSVDINSRLSHHKTKLRHGKHFNKKLQNAVNKYGLDNFIFQMHEECPQDRLIIREAFWIYELNSVVNGYNIVHDTECPARELMKQKKYRDAVSIVHKGKIISKEHKESAHQINKLRFSPITLISPEGNLIMISGLRRFCIANNLSYRSIKNLRNGKIHHHKGWRNPLSEFMGIPFNFKHPMSIKQRELLSQRARLKIGKLNPNYKHGEYARLK